MEVSNSSSSPQSLKAFLFTLLAVGGLGGTILFCPLNLDSTNTCLFQQLLIQDRSTEYSGRQFTPGQDKSSQPNGNVDLFHRYMNSYSMWWWLSLVMLFTGVWGIYRTTAGLKRMLPKLDMYKLEKNA